jgi:hypothetical protein
MRLAALNRRWLLSVLGAPALLGGVLSAAVDWRDMPFVAGERFAGVLLVDGEAYFGHLDDDGTGGDVRLSDVYYFQDAQKGSSGLALGLVKRGAEAHQPTDQMRINRDHVLAVERLTPSSPVYRAIAAQRALGRDTGGAFFEVRTVGDRRLVDEQRVTVENDLARGFKTGVDTLEKSKELVLKITDAQAAALRAKGVEDLKNVRRAALVTLGTAVGMGQAEAAAYAAAAETRLDTPSDKIPATLLAPDLYAIVARADQLYAQASDAAIQQITSAR